MDNLALVHVADGAKDGADDPCSLVFRVWIATVEVATTAGLHDCVDVKEEHYMRSRWDCETDAPRKAH